MAEIKKSGFFDRILIVSDMDGTFLGTGAVLVDRNIKAVEYLKSQGGMFTFATGRVHFNIYRAIPDADKLCNAPAITANGACIFELETNTPIYENPMSLPDVVQAIRLAHKSFPTIGARCSTDYGMLTDELTSLIEKDMLMFRQGRIEKKSLDEWREDKIFKVVFRAEREELQALRDLLVPIFGDRFCYTASSPRFLELNAPGCSKADGIRFLKKRYPERKIIAVGDYENDLEMLRAADISVCPANALDAVKRETNLTLCDCNDGVIGDIVEMVEKMGID